MKNIKYMAILHGLRFEIPEGRARDLINNEENFQTGYERCLTKGCAIRVCTDGTQVFFERVIQDV